jgi:hypothetical protein
MRKNNRTPLASTLASGLHAILRRMNAPAAIDDATREFVPALQLNSIVFPLGPVLLTNDPVLPGQVPVVSTVVQSADVASPNDEPPKVFSDTSFVPKIASIRLTKNPMRDKVTVPVTLVPPVPTQFKTKRSFPDVPVIIGTIPQSNASGVTSDTASAWPYAPI